MSTEQAPDDLLDPLPPLEVGSSTVHVDASRPVAAIVATDGAVRFVTWPDAPLPPRSTRASAFATRDGFWVVYVEDSDDEVESEKPRTIAVRVGLDGAWSAVDVGDLTVIGVAADAVWATPIPSVSTDDDDDDVDGDLGGYDEGPIAGVDYDADAPIESFEDFNPRARGMSPDDDGFDDDAAADDDDDDDLPDLTTLAADGKS